MLQEVIDLIDMQPNATQEEAMQPNATQEEAMHFDATQ